MPLFEIPYQIKGNNLTKTLQGLVTKKRLKKWHFFTVFQKPVWAFCPTFCLRISEKSCFLRWNLRRPFARCTLKKHVFSSKPSNFTFAFCKCTLWISASFWYFVRLKSSTSKNLRHFLHENDKNVPVPSEKCVIWQNPEKRWNKGNFPSKKLKKPCYGCFDPTHHFFDVATFAFAFFTFLVQKSI